MLNGIRTYKERRGTALNITRAGPQLPQALTMAIKKMYTTIHPKATGEE